MKENQLDSFTLSFIGDGFVIITKAKEKATHKNAQAVKNREAEDTKKNSPLLLLESNAQN